MNESSISCGLRGFGSALPEQFMPLDRLRLESAPDRLAGFGFEGAYVAEDAYPLAECASRRALADAALRPDDVDMLLWVSALAGSHHCASAVRDAGALGGFCYAASRLQETLGCCRAGVSGVAQQGCAGLFSALRQARGLLAAEPALQQILCVAADALPADASREILYNVISDAACAVVVSRTKTSLRWRGFQQISKGYYWDVPEKQSEIIAAYFPTARVAILEALKQSGLAPSEVDLVIPTGVNASSWPILLRLCGIPEDRMFRPTRRFGHTIAGDSFLMLEDARAAGALQPGMRVLLFAFGFGSSWCALLLEVADGF